MKNKRLTSGQPKSLGQPLQRRPLKGSYLLRLQMEGYHDTIYPIYVDRTGEVDGRDPNGVAQPIELLPNGTLGPEDCYVPAGWCHLGGDPNTPNSLPRQRVWVDGFVIGRFSVTNAIPCLLMI